MKWIKTKTNTNHECYELWNEKTHVLTAIIDQTEGTITVNGETKRRFIIEQQGLLRQKSIFCNEYGIMLGYSIIKKPNHEGYIYMNNEEFYFNVETYPEIKLVVKNTSKETELFSFGLTTNSLLHNEEEIDSNYPWLLLTISWYNFIYASSTKAIEKVA